MQFCARCVTPVLNTAEGPQMDDPVFVENWSSKKKHRDIIAIIIVLILLAGA